MIRHGEVIFVGDTLGLCMCVGGEEDIGYVPMANGLEIRHCMWSYRMHAFVPRQ